MTCLQRTASFMHARMPKADTSVQRHIYSSERVGLLGPRPYRHLVDTSGQGCC
jgi:hypothetical protein